MSKVYLGDAVYAERDQAGRVVLSTAHSSGDYDSNRIVLEAQVLELLLAFVLTPGAFEALQAYDRAVDATHGGQS